MNPNDAIEVLIGEHRIILQVIEGLAGLARHLREGRDVDVSQLREAIAFLREFADHRHHAKEKDLLYPACIDYGVRLSGDPMAALLDELRESRRLRDQLANSTKEFAAHRAAGANEGVSATIDAIVKLYSHHISNEEETVFPMAKRLLPVETLNRLYAQFEEADARNSHGVCERFHEFARRLSAIAAQ